MLQPTVPEAAPSPETCVVCGASANTNDIEDTNGWRWFSDGRGGLSSLCATCPVPEEFLEAAAAASKSA